MASKFDVFVCENHGKLHCTGYLNFVKDLINHVLFIANYNLCTTIELSTLLTSCLTAIRNGVIKYYETVYVGVGGGSHNYYYYYNTEFI